MKEGGGWHAAALEAPEFLQQPDRDLRVVPATLTRCNRTLLCGFATLRTDGLWIDISLQLHTATKEQVGLSIDISLHITQKPVRLSIDISVHGLRNRLACRLTSVIWHKGPSGHYNGCVHMRFGRVIVFQRPNHPLFSHVYHSMSKLGDKPGFVVLPHCSAVLRIREWYPTVITLGVYSPTCARNFQRSNFGM